MAGDGRTAARPRVLSRTILHLRSSRSLAGPERHLLELLPGLAELGFAAEVALLYRRRQGDPAEHPLLGGLAAAGIPACQIDDPDRLGRTARRALAERLRRGDVAALHGHDPKSDWVIARSARATGAGAGPQSMRRLATLHLYTRETMPLRLYRHLDRRLLRRFDGVIAVTSALAAELARSTRRQGGPRGRIIPNGIDGGRLRARAAAALPSVRAELATLSRPGNAGGSGGGPVLLAAGRLARQKGFDLLLDALPAVLVRHPGLLLLIAGEGPERSALATQAERLRLQGRVHFLGARGDLAALLAAADGFVLSSRGEGSPFVLLEALALGVPVVATAVGGVAEMLGSGAESELVSPGDPAALAGSILRLLQFPESARRRAEAAREAVAGRLGLPDGGRNRRLLRRDPGLRTVHCGS